LLAGGCVGAGVAVLVAAMLPAVPDLRAALERLDGRAAPPVAVSGGPSVFGRARQQWLPPLAETLGLRRYAAELRVVGETAEVLALRKAGYALLGLVFPLVLAAASSLFGVKLPLVIAPVAGLALGAVLFFVPDLDLHKRAAEGREAMRRTVCAYLELVALERAADAGTVEALDRAAALGDGPQFARIRDALLHAQLAGQPPWHGLTELAAELAVPELEDLADIMRLSGEDGAAVYATLRARAASLRTQLLAANTTKANAASEHMIVPVALLGIAFMALVGYPAFARILFD
jgi:hypothetical protein